MQMRGGLRKMIAFLQLRTPSGMPLTMPDTQILSHKRSVAVREITAVDLLGSV